MGTESKVNMAAAVVAVIISVLANAVLIGVAYGRIDERFKPIEAHVQLDTTDRLMAMFVSRNEWVQRNTSRDLELSEIKDSLKQLNAKMDLILMNQSKKTAQVSPSH